MKKEDVKYGAYVQILKEELVPAMGCTEPIALAYAAAKAREILGSIPDKVVIEASGSIIKNVKKRHCAKHKSSERNSGGCHSGNYCGKSGERTGSDCTGDRVRD